MKTFLLSLLLLPSIVWGGEYKTITLSDNNTINFNQVFSGTYIASKQLEAIELCSRNPGSDIYIVAYTPGGSISAGKLFFDTLKALDCNFHTITIFSASMGYQMTQNLGKRYILPSGTLMSHRASVRGLSGEIGGDLDNLYNLIKSNVNSMETIAAKRVGISLEKYKKDISDELWLTADEAVKSNHADEVILVKCDSSLLLSVFERVATFFGVFEVEFSKCPIITAPISVSRGSFDEFSDYHNNLNKYIEYTL